MTTCSSETLDQFYDVVEFRLFLSRGRLGWTIEEWHRHETGRWGQCVTNRYAFLSAAEALDALDAIADELLHSEPPGEPPPSS